LRVLHVITARGGSKGVPRKNLLQLGGISLVAFKAISARKSRHCARLIVSSDSPDIQAEARRYGAEAPFTRPAELATDEASTEDVIWHAMQWVEAHDASRYDAVMILEPSSPFATAADFDRAVDVMTSRCANVVVSVCKAAVHSVFHGAMDAEGRIGGVVSNLRSLRSVRRQDMPDEYTQNGGLYLVRWDYFARHRTRYHDPDTTYAIEMDRLHSIEIDEPVDLAFAQFLVATEAIDLTPWTQAT
jgi:N-acylneuraminate cytidylyltransferase/CMP-N,N'-diacetyllegionaminic acid synthase